VPRRSLHRYFDPRPINWLSQLIQSQNTHRTLVAQFVIENGRGDHPERPGLRISDVLIGSRNWSVQTEHVDVGTSLWLVVDDHFVGLSKPSVLLQGYTETWGYGA
ncbi:uncharacterized protein METZ01_LOCUS200096, partial [marine metagenome]